MRSSTLPFLPPFRFRKPAAAFRAWADRRLGDEATQVTLTGGRIYIVPTRFGAVFACLLLVMLLGATNYGASLGFGLTFLLAGVGLVALRHCRDNLLGLELRALGAPRGFAGDAVRFRLEFANPSAAARYELDLALGSATAGPVDLAAGETAVIEVPVVATQRGYLRLPRVTIATRHPASLFRAFAYARLDAHALVYPRPAPRGRVAPPGMGDGPGRGAARAGDDDFAGLRRATPSDSPRQLAWKAYARTGVLLRKEFTTEQSLVHRFDFDTLTDLDTEARLAQLARWCVDAAAAGAAFELRLPGTEVPGGHGDIHLACCLERLALHDRPAPQ